MKAIKSHRDGMGAETIERGLTAAQAREWLNRKSEETGQPVLPDSDDGGVGIVNESAEENCGYFFATDDHSAGCSCGSSECPEWQAAQAGQ